MPYTVHVGKRFHHDVTVGCPVKQMSDDDVTIQSRRGAQSTYVIFSRSIFRTSSVIRIVFNTSLNEGQIKNESNIFNLNN